MCLWDPLLMKFPSDGDESVISHVHDCTWTVGYLRKHCDNPETSDLSDYIVALRHKEERIPLSSFPTYKDMEEWMDSHHGSQIVFIEKENSIGSLSSSA